MEFMLKYKAGRKIPPPKSTKSGHLLCLEEEKKWFPDQKTLEGPPRCWAEQQLCTWPGGQLLSFGGCSLCFARPFLLSIVWRSMSASSCWDLGVLGVLGYCRYQANLSSMPTSWNLWLLMGCSSEGFVLGPLCFSLRNSFSVPAPSGFSEPRAKTGFPMWHHSFSKWIICSCAMEGWL